MYHVILFWLGVSVEKSADSLMRVPLYVVISPLLLLIFHLCLWFLSAWLLCVLVCSWVYPYGTLCVFWTWPFPFPCYGSFQPLPLQILSQVLSLLSFGIPIMWMLVHLILSQRSLRLSFFAPYILFCGSDFHQSVLQGIYPFFGLSYSAIDPFECIIHLCLFVH